MDIKNVIQRVRAFNRFYMPKMNLLGNHYLGSEYSVTPARIFFEIYKNEGCTAAHIAQIMNIDKGYLSRIIISHEKNGYISRLQSDSDGRSYQLYLTEQGKARAKNFIKKSDEEIGEILRNLSEDELIRLEEAFETITKLLQKGNTGES